MFQGRSTCPSQWTTEYSGFWVTERDSHQKSLGVCVDKDTQASDTLSGSEVNDNGALWYEARVGHCGVFCDIATGNLDSITCAVCTPPIEIVCPALTQYSSPQSLVRIVAGCAGTDTAGDACILACKEGYERLSGPLELTCSASGAYEPSQPLVCVPLAIAEPLSGYADTFVAWGLDSCPDSSVLIYQGVTLGARVDHQGSFASRQCGHREPSRAFSEPGQFVCFDLIFSC